MRDKFFRFPHTPHVSWLAAGTPRDDKVLTPSEAAEILSHPVVLEEKLDGANLGLSVGSEGSLKAQNRGAYLQPPFSGQFGRLNAWIERHEDDLFDLLGTHLIAFGEWCAARHSLDYSELPDWWLLFDIYDRREQRFWSTARRNDWAAALGLSTVPEVHRGIVDLQDLVQLTERTSSRYRNGGVEGLIVRSENALWLHARAKLVRSDFTQRLSEHWSRRKIDWNRLMAPTG